MPAELQDPPASLEAIPTPAAEADAATQSFVDLMGSKLDAAFAGVDEAKKNPTKRSAKVVEAQVMDAPAPEVSDKPASTKAKTKAPKPITKAATLDDLLGDDTPEVEDTDIEPAAETTTDDLLDQIGDEFEDWTPKAAARFKQLKAELKEHKTQLETTRQQAREYEQKVKELSGEVESEEFKSVKEKLAAYEKRMALVDLESTEAYQESVTRPLQAILEQAETIAAKYQVEPRDLIEALALPSADEQEERILELLPRASERDKAKVFRMIEDLEPLAARKKELSENAAEALKEAKLLEEQRAKQTAAQAAETRRQATSKVVERVREKLPFLADSVKWDDLTKLAADIDPSVAKPVDLAYQAVAAQLLPTLVRNYMQGQKELEALTDRLAEFEQATPKAGGGSAAGKTPMTPASGESFADAVNRQLANLGLG